MKKLIITAITISLNYSLTAQFGGLKVPKIKKEEKTTASGSTSSSAKATAYNYDKDGYIIDEPSVLKYLESKDKLYVTPFTDATYNPKFMNSKAPSDYAYTYFSKFNDGTKILDITFLNKTKTPNPRIETGEILYSISRLENISGTNLYGDIYTGAEVQANGDVLFFNTTNKKINQVFYLTVAKEQSASASGNYQNYVTKADEAYKKLATLIDKKIKADYVNFGLEAYEKYKTGTKKPALEATMIAVANKNSEPNKEHGKLTYSHLMFIDNNWEVFKNDFGIPVDEQMACYGVGKYADGTCFIKQLEFKKDYIGGGKYANEIKLFSDHSDFPLSCDKVK